MVAFNRITSEVKKFDIILFLMLLVSGGTPTYDTWQQND